MNLIITYQYHYLFTWASLIALAESLVRSSSLPAATNPLISDLKSPESSSDKASSKVLSYSIKNSFYWLNSSNIVLEILLITFKYRNASYNRYVGVRSLCAPWGSSGGIFTKILDLYGRSWLGYKWGHGTCEICHHCWP